MKTIAIAGASGVVGRHLVDLALARGLQVRILSRSGRSGRSGVQVAVWDPHAAAQDGPGGETARGPIRDALEGTSLVVNLAGASLAEGRLGRAHRQKVLQSRLQATRALVRSHAACSEPPPVWFQASATGFYGDTGEADVDEASPRGGMFLSEVCERWEAAAKALDEQQVRLVVGRIGLVLAGDAPAFQKLLTPTLFGLGGPLGSGRQWWAWIDADDLARAILFLADRDDARGAYNLTTAAPVRQADLAQQIATCVGRPALLPAPAFALRLALGGVADELLLPSCRALPRRLDDLGFTWRRGALGRALIDIFDGLERST